MSHRIPLSLQGNRTRIHLTLIGVILATGFFTLVIVLGAVFGGMWLDAQFQTRPAITLVSVFASIPISLIVTLLVVRKATAKIQANL